MAPCSPQLHRGSAHAGWAGGSLSLPCPCPGGGEGKAEPSSSRDTPVGRSRGSLCSSGLSPPGRCEDLWFSMVVPLLSPDLGSVWGEMDPLSGLD